MKNLRRFLACIMVFAIFLGIVIPPNVFAATSFSITDKVNVDVNKIWTIKFNNELDKSTIDGKDSVIVLNDKGEKVDIKISYKDNRTLVISPVTQYEYGKTYILTIKSIIKSRYGKNMNNSIQMRFTTKNSSDKPLNPNDNVVVLDAGRAENDIGAEVGPTGIKGKDINLAVVLKAGKILEDNGVKVVYTRKTDMVPWSSSESISARNKIVNDAKADILVSVHCNTADSSISGTETYYLKGNSQSQKLSSYIQTELVNKAGLANRGIKESTYKTLSDIQATGAYVDLGFISNPKEEKIMNSEEFKNNSASAIANAVLKYLDINSTTYIKAIGDMSTILYKGEKYTFPSVVKAVMSDNTEKSVSVKWDNTYLDTSKPGTYYYKGTVLGYDKEVNLKIVVNSSSNIDLSKVTKVCIDAASASNLKVLTGPTGVKDKDVNLAIALKLGKLLESKGVKVTYTRKSDSVSWSESEDVSKRDKIASDSGSEVLISIRSNYYSSLTAEGVETYYLGTDNTSKILSQEVQKNVVFNTVAKDRGAKEVGENHIKFLQGFNGVGILVYAGFISNANEEKLLNSSQYQDKIVQGIAEGILNGSSSSNVISSVKNVTANITQGNGYNLPTKVAAIDNKGNSVQADVAWEVNSIDTSKAGTYVIKGRVKNYSELITLTVVVSPKSSAKYKICIDAGHGGYDSGAVGPGGTKEKDVVLQVALKLGNILTKNGIDVVYTRTSDNVPWPANKSAELKMRCDISDEAKATYFVSIHANSVDGSPSTSGIETLYGDNRTDGIPLARNIQNEMVATMGGKDRGLKERAVYVVKWTNAPSALVELEFISNPQKEKLLKTPEYQQRCAEAIARGIMKTLR